MNIVMFRVGYVFGCGKVIGETDLIRDITNRLPNLKSIP